MREKAHWEWHLQGVALLGEFFGPNVPRLLAYGPSTLTRMQDIFDAWPGDVTFASQLPWRLAVGGQRLTESLDRIRVADDVSIDELILKNVTSFASSVALARTRTRVLANR
jgi:hypothetical protein